MGKPRLYMGEGEVTPTAFARCHSSPEHPSLALSVGHRHLIPLCQGGEQRLALVFNTGPNLCIRKEMTGQPHLLLKLHPSVRSLLEVTEKTILVCPNCPGIVTVPTMVGEGSHLPDEIQRTGNNWEDVWDKMHFQRKHSTTSLPCCPQLPISPRSE